MDLVPSGGSLPGYSLLGSMPTHQGLDFLAGENAEATIIDSLTLDQYHSICYWQFSVIRSISIATSSRVKIGTVSNSVPEDTLDNMLEIAWLPNTELAWPAVWHSIGNEWRLGELMVDGWTRFDSTDAIDTVITVEFWAHTQSWLSQANHIFTSLEVSSDFQHYGAIVMPFNIAVTISTTDTPIGFLFLCSPDDFQTGQFSYKWPDCPAYWSLDPSGAERLTLEEAFALGFPSLQFSTRLERKSWDASVYAGLRHFHQAKGFDPDSQDVARHLGYPLYQFSGLTRMDTPFAHIDDQYSDNVDNGDDTSGDATNEELNDAPESSPTDHDFAPQDVAEAPASRTLEQIVDSTPTDCDSVAGSNHQAMEGILVSSTFEEIPESTMDPLDLPILSSANADAEEVPLSGTFKFVIAVKLSLILFLSLCWALYEM
ncbi:hypothetical protein C8R45DRAFT_1115422 [Mycena sanguinolenta]|nr:hypothetical protein C8R45DRAFT_1115422 [Mycena sanguinolenta]